MLDTGGAAGLGTGEALETLDESRSVWTIAAVPPARRELTAARSDLYGISEVDLDRLAACPAEALADYLVDSAAWLAKLKSVFSQPSPPLDLDAHGPAAPMVGAFLRVVEPLLAQARDALREGLRAVVERAPSGPLRVETAEAAVLANLPHLVLPFLTRTLVLELNVARLSGRLDGDTREERFNSFCRSLHDPDAAASLLHEYPVLARQVVEAVDRWVDFSLEFLERLATDWHRIRQAFSPDEDPGTLVKIDDHMGDRHRQGRCVMAATFTSGIRVVYKPRSLAVDVHFQQLVVWLNERGQRPRLRPMRVVDRGNYGWSEFIPFQGCASPQEVKRFYRRQGSYLALLYALRATDFHFENLIASGEHPYPIDLETLFHPPLTDPPKDSGASTLRESVLRVGLLPRRVTFGAAADGVDFSGMGAGAGSATAMIVSQWEAAGTDEMRLVELPVTPSSTRNRPTVDGREVDLLEHAGQIGDGFAQTYSILAQNRDELLAEDGPLSAFADDEIRVVLRPTRTYASLLQAAVHPDALGDAVYQGRVFEALVDETEARPNLRRVLGAEFRDLRNGDVPFFSTTAGSRDLMTSSGERVVHFFDEPPLNRVRNRIRDLDDHDLHRQLWLTRASLATVAMSDESAHWPVGQLPERPAALDVEHILEHARSIGERIADLAQHTHDGAAEWMGVRLAAKGRWSLMPAGIDLYSGRTGIALFLAYLGSVCAEPRFEYLSRATIDAIREQVTRSPLHHFPIGAFDGLAGVAYTMAHAAALWDDPDLLAEAHRLGQNIGSLARYDSKLDVIGGTAGCVAALLAVHDVSPSDAVMTAAIQCGNHLLKCANRTETGTTWPPQVPSWTPLTGFSHGNAGIGWALLELAERTGDQRFREAGHDAYRYEHGQYVPSARNWPDMRKFDTDETAPDPRTANCLTTWCHGAAGIALSRLQSRRLAASKQILGDITADLDAALDAVRRDGFGRNHSLCHGDLGNLDVLLQAANTYDDQEWVTRAQNTAASIIQGAASTGWLCGLPLGVESPGLMTGLAGIGMGLLRVAARHRVPSVLILEPPKRNASIQGSH